MRKFVTRFVVATLVLLYNGSPSADEGMWTFDNFPVKRVEAKYGFKVDSLWLNYVQRSSARLPNCSSSFVSGDGLVMTNGHCAEGAVQALSTPRNNLYEKGFYASRYRDELKTDLTLRVLHKFGDATDWINQQVKEDKSGNLAEARQRAILNTQKQSSEINDLTCEIVVLYQGAQYYNYCYKVYTDVRLVFSSEKNTWFFGGDADNFEYPRYAMDVAFLRAYEKGKPARTPLHFGWSKNGAKESELIFVSGHPGSTKRLLTPEALKTERDIKAPFLLDLFRRREITLQQFMLGGKEQRRIAQADLFSWQNSRKLYVGKIRGLQDPKLVEAKENSEKQFYKDAYNNPSLAGEYANGLIMINEAQEEIRKNYARYMLLVQGLGFDSQLLGYAQSIVSGNREAARAVLHSREKEPSLNLEYEEAKLKDSLSHFIEVFGSESSIVKNMPYHLWGGPSDIAHELVFDTWLTDINKHRLMVAGMNDPDDDGDGTDSMLSLADYIKKESDQYRRSFNSALEQERRGYALISDALFKMYGTNRYPDATFTLRLSYGTVSGYENYKPFTTIGGAYQHSSDFGNQGDYKLPRRWWLGKHNVKLRTPLDFVADLDITGGNSGSPVFNKDLEIVGIVFDGNRESLVGDYDYNYSPNNRAVAVSSVGIVEILKNIYHADRLVRELTRF